MIISVVVGVIGVIIAIAVTGGIGAVTSLSGSVSSTPVPPTGAPSIIPNIKMKTATSHSTIKKMRTAFATHGLPEMLVTDNGSVFTSAEFRDFAASSGIRHVTTFPYHPASNGLAECAVQTFKRSMKKMTTGSLEERVSKFLFKYTPHFDWPPSW